MIYFQNLVNLIYKYASYTLIKLHHLLGSETTRKSSLTPPSEPDSSWQNYINSPPGEPPCLGREHLCKESRKTFKATVAMSEEFPLTVEMLLSVLEVLIKVQKMINVIVFIFQQFLLQ